MHPLFNAPAVDRAADRYAAAESELTRRTGRAFYPDGNWRVFDAARHVTEDEVLRVAPDLAAPLNVFPCACGCWRAGTVVARGAWYASGCTKEV